MSVETLIDEPVRCDIHPDHGYAAVDGRMTDQGSWAYMCSTCWALYGCDQFGTGHGQRLLLRDIPDRHAALVNRILNGEPVTTERAGIYLAGPEQEFDWEAVAAWPVPPDERMVVLPPLRVDGHLIFLWEMHDLED